MSGSLLSSEPCVTCSDHQDALSALFSIDRGGLTMPWPSGKWATATASTSKASREDQSSLEEGDL